MGAYPGVGACPGHDGILQSISLILCIPVSFKGTKMKSEMVDSFAHLLKLFSSLQELKYVNFVGLGRVWGLSRGYKEN